MNAAFKRKRIYRISFDKFDIKLNHWINIYVCVWVFLPILPFVVVGCPMGLKIKRNISMPCIKQMAWKTLASQIGYALCDRIRIFKCRLGKHFAFESTEKRNAIRHKAEWKRELCECQQKWLRIWYDLLLPFSFKCKTIVLEFAETRSWDSIWSHWKHW